MPLLNFPAPGSTDAKQHLISFGGIDLVPSNSYSYTNLLSYSENFLHPSWFRTANDIVVNKNYDYLDVYLNDYDIVTDSVFKLDKNNTDTGFILTTKTDNAIFGQNISVVANTNYVLSFYAKTYTVANCFYRIVDATNQSNIISSTNYASNSSAQWNRISVPFTTPNNCTLITVILRDSGVSDSTGLITLSNPQLELGNISTFYKPTISTVNTSDTGQFIANAKSILGNLGMYSDTTYNWGEVLPITGVSTTKYNTANVYIDDSDILTKTTIQSANITLYFPEQPRAAYYAGDVIRLIDNITGNITLYSVLNGDRSSVQIITSSNINDSSLTISATTTTVYDKTKLFFDYSNRSVLLEDSNIRKNYYLTEYFKANRSTKVVLQQVEMRESLTYKLIGDLYTVRNSIVLKPDSGNDLLRTGQVKASVIVKPILSKKDYTYINPIKTQVQQPVQSSITVANLLKIQFPRLTSYIDAKTLGTVGNSRLRELRGVKDNLKSGTMIRNKVPLNSVSFVDLGIKFPKLTQYLKLRETVSLALPINRIESNTVSITASTITDLALNPVKTSYTPIERYLFTIASHLNPIKTSPEIITNSLENLLKPFFTKITPKFSLLGDAVKILSSSGISPVPAKSLKATFSYSYTDVTNTNLKTVSLLKKYNNQGSVYPTMPVIGFSDVQNNLVSTYINDSDILTLTVSNTAPTQSITVNPVVKLQSPAAYFDGYTKYVDTNASSMLAFGPTATIEMMIQPTKRYPLQVIASFYSSDNYNRFVNATGGTVTYSGDFKIHTFSTSGLFTVTSATNNSTVEVLIVGGGGGGGAYYGGGGGGGGVVYLSSAPIILNTYTIIVGSGGTAAVGSVGTNGSLSSAFGARAFGGGAGTNHDVGDGASGGSGGGAASNNSRLNIGGFPVVGDIGLGNTGQSYGNRGGYMLVARTGTPTRAAGGGGAGTAGFDTNSNFTGTTILGGFSSGGNGIINGITGTYYYYAGGGGGGSYTSMGGTGGLGGGGGGGGEIIARAPGGTGGLSVGEPGTTNGGKGGLNTGGGGGGGTAIGSSGGTGGSGVVIIKYRYKRDSSVYAVKYPEPSIPITVEYLVVAGGGGGGGWFGAGAGGGGVLTGNVALLTSTDYTITIGSGGVAGSGAIGAGGTSSSNGGNSSITGTSVSVISLGGGGGGTYQYFNSQEGTFGANGASGGGGSTSEFNSPAGAVSPGGTGIPGQGNNGGSGYSKPPYVSGGGGGAGAAGGNAVGSAAGNGGIGIQNSLTGTATYYGGGGGGAAFTFTNGSTVGTGGQGGGAPGSGTNGGTSASGTANTGGGGGGGPFQGTGGRGGSGIIVLRVISRYTAIFSSGIIANVSASTSQVGYNTYVVTGGTGTVTFK